MEDEGDIADAEGESDGTVSGLDSMARCRKKSSCVDWLKADDVQSKIRELTQ
jgi:hypothetical protein